MGSGALGVGFKFSGKSLNYWPRGLGCRVFGGG